MTPTHTPGISTRRGFWTRNLRPTPAERDRMNSVQSRLLLGLIYLITVFAYAFPPDWRSPSRTYTAVAWSAFLVRIFQFHMGILVLLIIAWCARYKRWRTILAALPILVFTWAPVAASFLPKSPPPTHGQGITVTSCNLLMINRQTDRVIEELAATDPDVILFQEYTDHWHAALQRAFSEQYPHVVYFPREDSFGAAIYSRLPFVGKPNKFLRIGTFGEPQMRAVVSVDGRDIAIYNLHLVPPWGGIAYIQEHSRQFADLLDLLAEETLPTVVAGDFNFTPSTPHAAALANQNFRDAHDQAGSGRGATWSEHGIYRFLPGLRLDHIYLSDELGCTRFHVGDAAGSDHRPITAHIAPRR